ncbi:MAG: divalent-cation tolerance protein CutA [Planctomycetota bacterium]
MYCVVLVTVPTRKIAKQIAKKVVIKKLAACVNIIPNIRSFYIWDRKLCNDKEFLLVIKTRKTIFNQLSEEIKLSHPYKIPEIIALPIVHGTKEYIKWLKTNCK